VVLLDRKFYFKKKLAESFLIKFSKISSNFHPEFWNSGPLHAFETVALHGCTAWHLGCLCAYRERIAYMPLKIGLISYIPLTLYVIDPNLRNLSCHSPSVDRVLTINFKGKKSYLPF
jgi:hypothetical protein